MHPIIILWSHPRSMSTAMERVMRERGDLQCFHEPFMYDYYIARKIREMPHFAPEAGRPVSYAQVRDTLLEAAQTGPVFAKDMSYYVYPHILEDDAFGARLTNAFLIRDPVASIPSYHKLDPGFTSEELGLEAQAMHFDALAERGEAPIVLCAEDIRADPMGVIRAFWTAIGLPQADHAFDWGNAAPDDWQQVGAWHGNASASTRIEPITPEQKRASRATFDALAKTHPHLQAMYDHHKPFYDKLKSQALPG